jgi:hypothetical protein
VADDLRALDEADVPEEAEAWLRLHAILPTRH